MNPDQFEEISQEEFNSLLTHWYTRTSRINPLTENLEVTYFDYQNKFLALAIIPPDYKEKFYEEKFYKEI